MTATLQPPAAVRPAAPVATTMRAAVIVAPGQAEVREVPVPVPGAGEVRVKLDGCGVCASNIPPWEGRDWFQYPFAPGQLGHEAWGTVDAVGPAGGATPDAGLRVGDRVAMLSDHAYAEYDVAPAEKVVKLPAALAGQPFPAEPLGCAMNIFARSGIADADGRPGVGGRADGKTVAIVGVGFLGAILARLATNAGARVIAVSRRPFSLDVARDMGAAETIPMDDHWKIIEQVKQLTGGRFCDVVVEAVGKEWPLNLSAELTKERGRLVVAGYHQDGLRAVNMQLWNWRGLDVINAHERDPAVYVAGMRAAVDAVASGAVDPSPLYTHTYRLDQLGEALNATKERPDGFLKALVTM